MSEEVREYYDYSIPLYKLFWHGETRGIHYGIWRNGVTSHHEALLESNRELAELAEMKEGDRVLDAGCGVGGSGLWLSQHMDVEVVGITVSQKQLEKAEELASRYGASQKLSFKKMSFLSLEFKDQEFDVVWGLESVCYGHTEIYQVLKEFFRVLKPGGRLVLGDGYFAKPDVNGEELGWAKDFHKGFQLRWPMISAYTMSSEMKKVGFQNVKEEDVTEYIMPTANRMWKLCVWAYPLARITEFLRLTPSFITANNLTGIVQYKLFAKRIFTYNLHKATKPHDSK